MGFVVNGKISGQWYKHSGNILFCGKLLISTLSISLHAVKQWILMADIFHLSEPLHYAY